MKNASRLRILPHVVTFFAGSVLTAALLKGPALLKRLGPAESPTPTERHLGTRGFVNPLLDCPEYPTDLPPLQADLEKNVQKFIQAKQRGGQIETASVYYRDLNNGPWFGINQDTTFSAASLLKVPVLIGYFRLARANPQFLKETVVYDPKVHFIPNMTPTLIIPTPMTPGRAYTVLELLERMITMSDNNAAAMLLYHKPEFDVVAELKNMGIPVQVKNEDAWITVRGYSSMFRILYNSTYLEPDQSDLALQILTASKFSQGLDSGIDAPHPIAHKFGERTIGDLRQFHDCGIVYYPGRPYLLCVMTRGKEMVDLMGVVAGITRIVHDSVTEATQRR